MTVAELEARMTSAEYVEWAAHDTLTLFERQHAERAAQLGR